MKLPGPDNIFVTLTVRAPSVGFAWMGGVLQLLFHPPQGAKTYALHVSKVNA